MDHTHVADEAGLVADRLDRIDHHLLERYIDAGKIAGAEVAIVRDGVVGYRRSWGHRDRERGVAVGDDTIWRLYSMTKPVTGVAMMTL
jgi:CubicO group peptidase (beta-lactamase class C family)